MDYVKMMSGKNTVTLIGLVLDESGSMFGQTEQTIVSLNNYFDELKTDDSPCRVTLTKFASEVSVIRDNIALPELPTFNSENYAPDGMTALNDAIGQTITSLDKEIKSNPDAKVLIVVLTDGQENHSKEFKTDQIREMIVSREKEGNWTFVYLGAHADAFASAQSYGFSVNNTAQYDKHQTVGTMHALASSTGGLRCSSNRSTSNFVGANASAYQKAGSVLKPTLDNVTQDDTSDQDDTNA